MCTDHYVTPDCEAANAGFYGRLYCCAVMPILVISPHKGKNAVVGVGHIVLITQAVRLYELEA